MLKNKKIKEIIYLGAAIVTILGFIYTILISINSSTEIEQFNSSEIVNSNNQVDDKTVINAEMINIENGFQNESQLSTEEVDVIKAEIEKNIIEDLNNQLGKPDSLNLDWEEAYVYIIRNFKLKFSEVNECKFALHDMNHDGVPELFMNYWDRKNLVYTFNNNKLINIGETYNTLYISLNDNEILAYGGYGTGVGGIAKYYLDNMTLKREHVLEYSVHPTINIEEYYYHNKEISTEEFEEKVLELTSKNLEFSTIDDDLDSGTISFYVQN